ncbi:MAG: hypothetical protein ACJ70Z_09415 [Nitrososphaera sp.]
MLYFLIHAGQALWLKGIFLSQNAHATVEALLLVLDADTTIMDM